MKTRRNILIRHVTITLVVCGLVPSAVATTFDVPAGTTERLTTMIDVGEGLIKDGEGTLVVTIDQFINDDVIVNDGTLIFYGAADPEDSNPSFIVNNGTLMLGGDVGGLPVVLDGGTLTVGAQRTTTITSFGNARGHILGHTDTHNTSNHFALVSGNYFYSKQRAINQSQPQNVIDLGVPTSGLITSGLKPNVEFQVAVNGLDSANVNSHEGGDWRALTLNPSDRLRYASVDLLVSARGNIGGMFVRARWEDTNTTTSTGQTIPAMSSALSSNANTAFSGGVAADNGETYDPDTLMHLHHYTQHIDPTRPLRAMEFVRSGSSPTGTGLAFAVSGLAINDAAFTSNLTVSGNSLLDLAGAPVVDSQATLQAAGLDLDDARLTVTRSINNNTPHRTTFTGGTFTGEAWIETANSSGGGAGTVLVTGPVGGTGGLVKSGPGNLGLSGNNNFSGPSELLAGTIWLNSVTGLGSPDAGTTLAGGMLYLLNGSHTAPIAEPFEVIGNSNIRSGNGFAYTLAGAIDLMASVTTETDGGTVIRIEGAVEGPGTITKSGPGLLVLAGDNSFGSGTMVFGNGQNDRGHIRLESSTALGNHHLIDLAGTQAGVSGIQLAGDITVEQNILTRGRQNATSSGYILRNLSGDNTVNGDITITAGGGSYAIVCDDGRLTLNGVLSSNVASSQFGARLYTFAGAGDIVVGGTLEKTGEFAMQDLNVTKEGSGNLTLAGVNDYTGITNLNNGTTLLTGSITESAVVTLGADAVLDVSSHGSAGYAFGPGQTLRGAGTLAGNAAASGIVSPGFTTGVLSVDGNFTFGPGSTLVLDLDADGVAQVETATVASGVSPPPDAGDQTYQVAVTLTSAALQDSPLVLDVPVAGDAGSAEVAAAVRSALAADARVTAAFTVDGSNQQIVLTRLVAAANDPTLNLAIENGSPNPNITPAPVSANTAAGVAPGHDTFAVSGMLDVSGVTLDFRVTGTPTAPAYVIATYGGLAPTGSFAAVNDLPAGYVIDVAYDSGTAIALVADTAADAYASWAAANGIAGQPFGGDFDGDGISNGLEYALAGLTPNAPDGFPGSFDGGTLSFTKRPEAVTNGDVTYTIETSATMAPGSWTAVAAEVNNATTISYTLPAGQGRLFARLKVTASAP
jgi:autotransporter-associated beta strand protein